MKLALSALMNNTASTNKLYYPQSCFAIAKTIWPAGTMVYPPAPLEGPNAGQHPKPYPLTITYERVSCGGVGCCEITYQLDTVHQKMIPISVTSTGTCANITPPNPGIIIIQLTDTNGITTPVTGHILELSSCQTICSLVPPAVGYYKTDLNEMDKKIPLELNANPTMFNDYIKIVSEAQIQKVNVYDYQGQKVSSSLYLFENNELNTKELKPGIYYIQVQTSDATLKTIKVIKQ